MLKNKSLIGWLSNCTNCTNSSNTQNVARRRFCTTTAVVRHQRGGRHATAQLGSFCVLCGVVVCEEVLGKKNDTSLWVMNCGPVETKSSGTDCAVKIGLR